MYQSYNLFYNNQAAFGEQGESVLHSSGYVFIAPKIEVCLGKRSTTHFYLCPGVGYNITGKETTRKWNATYGSALLGNYDSTINTTANIKKLAFRINFGFTEYMYASRKWRVILTEDFGFLATDLTTTGSYTDPERTPYSVQDSKPVYISLLLGIDHRSVSNHVVND
jgi:hypothetical protein